jgi:hypothetical protein
MEINFMSMKTGRSTTKRIFVKQESDKEISYYSEGNDKGAIFVTDTDLVKTIVGFKQEFEGEK